MNSAQIVVGKIESRTEAGTPAGVSQPVGAPVERPRILELLLRIPVADADSQSAREVGEECACAGRRACPFRGLCLE
jgi:hypothetical protein